MTVNENFDTDYGFPTLTWVMSDLVAEGTQTIQPYKCAHSGRYAPRDKLVREPGTGMLVLPQYSNGRRSIPFAIGPKRK